MGEKPKRITRLEAISELKDIVKKLERKIERLESVINYLEDEEENEVVKDIIDEDYDM